MASSHIVGINFNMDSPQARATWAEAFGTSVPFDAVYSGKRPLTQTEIQHLFDISMLPVEQHVTATGAQLNDDQRLAVLAHMTTPDRGNHFPYDEPTMNRNNGITNALGAGDTHGILYHILYNNFVAPKLHQAATAIKSDYQKVSKAVGGVVENLPFGIGKSDAAPKSATSVPYDRAVPVADRGTPTDAVPYDRTTSVPYAGAVPAATTKGVTPALQAVVSRAMEISPVPFGMYPSGGVRTATEQKSLKDAGWSQTTKSAHLAGNAVDLIPIVDGKPAPNDDAGYAIVRAAMTQASKDLGVPLTYGADFKSPDKPHYEVTPQVAATFIKADPNTAYNAPPQIAFNAAQKVELSAAGYPIADTPSPDSSPTGSAAAYARATQFVGAAAAASALPSYESYSLGHVMMGSNPLRESIIGAANELGVNPVDLATAMSYETAGTLDPNQKGPTTKWGQMRGLIQWGEPQRVKYHVGDKTGITVSIPDQMRGIVKYLQDTGVKPGMGLKNIYAAINAGDALHIYAYDRGTTVLDKVAKMGPNRQQAEKLLGDAIPYEAKIASVVTGAGISANGMFERPPENYVGGGAAVYGGFTPVRASTHPLSAVVVTGAGNGGPFSTFTYGPGASTILSGGMGAGYQPQHSGSGNYSNVGEGGQPSHGGGGTGTGGGSGFSQDHGGSGNNSPGSYSNSTSGNSSGVGEGGVGSSYGSSGGGSAPSRGYSGSGNYSNVGEGGVSHSSPTSPENHTPVGSNGMFGSGV
jgi:hypothetical protein